MTEREGSELARIIGSLIKDKGPITFAGFMELALYHPEFGYYTSGKEVWGGGGDYITNADAGPVFTKLVAKQIEEMWRALSKPQDFTLIEAGGGRGIILKGILSSLKESFPALFDAVKVVMVERSTRLDGGCHGLDGLDGARLDGKTVDCYNDISSVGNVNSGVIFTNELLDALPFHRVVGGPSGIKEVFVDIDSDNGGFKDAAGEPSTERLGEYFAVLDMDLAEGQEAEVSLKSIEWIKEAGALIDKGFVISIDYGLPARDLFSPHRQGGTLLCHYRHTINDDPYRSVGFQDITAHVDFTSVVKAGLECGLLLTGFTNQPHFLMGLGIAEELEEVTDDSAQSLEAITHNQSIKELIMPGSAGENFKVLVQHKGVEAPALSGFSFKDRSSLL